MFNSDVKFICHILNRNVQEKTSSSKELYFANGTVRKCHHAKTWFLRMKKFPERCSVSPWVVSRSLASSSRQVANESDFSIPNMANFRHPELESWWVPRIFPFNVFTQAQGFPSETQNHVLVAIIAALLVTFPISACLIVDSSPYIHLEQSLWISLWSVKLPRNIGLNSMSFDDPLFLGWYTWIDPKCSWLTELIQPFFLVTKTSISVA